MAPSTTAQLGLEPWQIGDLRLTAFPVTPAEGKRWESLLGRRPETSSSRNLDAEIEESGPFTTGSTLTYRRNSQAMQWMLHSDKLGADSFMSAQALGPFSELIGRWLADCPSLQRLAFGAALYLPVKSRDDGYRRLESYLHLGLKYSDEEGDFLYQYNRRRRSQSVPEVKINRLSKWTWVPLGDVRVQDGKLEFPEKSACLLELDVNTVPEFQGTLPRDRCVPLFEEMTALAVEIAGRGDVP